MAVAWLLPQGGQGGGRTTVAGAVDTLAGGGGEVDLELVIRKRLLAGVIILEYSKIPCTLFP